MTHTLKLIQERLGDELPSAEGESLEIYSVLPDGIRLDEAIFLQQARVKVQEYRANSFVAQIRNQWNEITGTESPDDWSDKHHLPAAIIFTESDLNCDILAVLANPANYTPATLEKVLDTLQKMSTPDIVDCRRRFVGNVVPARFQKLKVDVKALCDWLLEHVDKNPNCWKMGQTLTQSIETFIKEQYQSSFREMAVRKINQLSGNDIKQRLLKLVEENPDIGLAFLEE